MAFICFAIDGVGFVITVSYLEHFSTVVKSVAEMFAFDKRTSELLFWLKTGNHVTNYL